jgi:hypothetical protein
LRTALVRRSAGKVSEAFRGARHQNSAAMMPKLLTQNIQKGIAIPSAAIATPPSAGPTARLRLKPTLLAAIAPPNSSRGTKSGVIDCHAGALNAPPTPSRKVEISKAAGEAKPRETRAARAADMTMIASSTTISSRLESMTSASAPAGSVNRNSGRLTAT